MQDCKKFSNFEASNNQTVTYVLMCKDKTNIRNEQVQTNFFDLFEAKKSVEVGFSAPDMTNLGGLPIISRIIKNDDLLVQLARKIKEWRDQKLIVHSIKEMVTQRVVQIAAGYEDADDCDVLRNDSMMKLASGRLPSDGALCSQPTMTRLENHVQHKELYDMGWVFVRHFVKSYDKEPKRIILDLDDSNSNCYGTQQLSVFNGYYGEYCYMPLFMFEGYSGKLIAAILRPGRTNKRDNVAGLLIRVITYLRKFWPNTVITVRGDGMFSSSEFMEWAKGQRRLHYVLGFSGNSRLSERTAAWVARAEEQYKRTGQDVKVYYRFMYRATRWERAQWMVVKIEFGSLGKNVRYVVTDMYDKKPQSVYENWYCKRGNCELYIKEMKGGLRADRMSCGSFSANQFRLFLHAAAYVLLLEAKHRLFAKSEQLATATIITLRKRIILQPARITELKTKIKIEFQRDNPMRDEILQALCA